MVKTLQFKLLFNLKREAKLNVMFTPVPHIQKINERFVYNDEMIGDNDLSDLFLKLREVNAIIQ